ncbi:hypothetical protein [Bradyrhizobium cytisi]|uniref:Uncharacterized protein n=1 Tax=Bradyrhizobium cytisi TaxID=515489 RepID=A0A5S4WVM0_9BRAD|nr:hypothetical protein [Bradyrhizobium cytisi]TYL85599.1 hypothetical protein FXB38_11030 [Bradyrhizobium cytisi]
MAKSIRSYQAIITKYLPASNVKGSRIKASAAAGSITIHLDHALNAEGNHAKAAEVLANKLGWRGAWIMGGMPGDSGYCFVCANGDAAAFTTEGESK